MLGLVQWPAIPAGQVNVGPLLSVCCDDTRQRARHHVFRRRQPQPPAFPVGHRQRRRLGVVEIVEHLPHVAEKRTADFRQPRAVPRLTVEQVRAQLFFDARTCREMMD